MCDSLCCLCRGRGVSFPLSGRSTRSSRQSVHTVPPRLSSPDQPRKSFWCASRTSRRSPSEMFVTATRNFVEEVDHDGFLIPVSSLNDSVALLSLVVKRKRFWFWQKPKYLPTDFTLNDLLTGDTPIKPTVIETDFIKYDGTFGDNIQGNIDANLAHSSLNFEGKDTTKLKSSFGTLKKQELDVQKLLRDSKDRVLDMSHCLIQQTKEKHRQSFGVVKERIVTTQPSSVIEEVQQGGQCGGLLSLCGPKSTKVSLKENGSLSKDSNVTMEIPPQTVVAFGLIELEVKLSGHFELCLMSDTRGGFEVDGLLKGLLSSSGAPVRAAEQSCLRRELDQLSCHFHLLSALPASTRSSLLQHLMTATQDREAFCALENVMELMCLGKHPALGEVRTESQRQNIQAVLDLLELSGQVEHAQTALSDQSTSVVRAFHLIISALDEMTDDCLAVLRMHSTPTVLQALELLVQCVAGGGETPLSTSGLAPLTEGFEKTQHLFASCNVTLKRDGDAVKMEINHQPGDLPLILCIAIRGLASLAHSV
ncbi:gasdermin Eb [Myripristis murdjan]|uniref:Gasdermin Eb n=1 Tax=Myripristis murdjan TaxID=586833 RepID=A0A668AEU0_9TELE|nr:gasdermin-E [Myripristis murdjan]